MVAKDGESKPGVNGNSARADGRGAVDGAQPGSPFNDRTLAEELFEEPFRFEFFAALRVLARMAAKDAATEEEPRPTIEQIQFRAYQALSFPPSELWDLKRATSGSRAVEMTVAFLGMTGPIGALPRPYTELVMQRIRKGDFAIRDFFDIFNDRLIQIFAQAGEKYRFYLSFERAAAREQWRRAQGGRKLRAYFLDERPRLDLFSQVLLDVGGFGAGLLRYKDSQRSEPIARHDVPDSALRYFGGQFAQSHRCAVSLERMLTEYFRVAARILPFIGQWILLPVEHQTCLRRSATNTPAKEGSRAARGKCSHPRLGTNTVVGSRVFEVQGRFRVRLGPLSFEQFSKFLPIGDKYRELAHFVRLYAGPTLDFDVQPVLEGEEVPWCQFGAKGSRSPRLGWNTWLRNRQFSKPVDDAIFRVPDLVSMNS